MKKKTAVRNKIFAWLLVFVMVLSVSPSDVFATEGNDAGTAIDGAEEARIDSNCTGNEEGISESVRSLQEQINALPTGEEYRNMSADEQDAVYELAASVSDAYIELSEEDQAKLDITRLEELFAVMNEGVAVYGVGEGNYEPLEISAASLNGNAIWGLTEAWSSSIGLDDSAAFYAQSNDRNSGTGGLPTDGVLRTANGTPYQLATGGDSATAYDGKDCIWLHSGSKSVTMDLQTIGVYQNIYVLATAGGPGGTNYAKFNVTLNYTDGETDETTYKLYDWYGLTPVPGVEQYYPVMRKEKSNGSYTGKMDSSYGPILQSATIQADSSKLLKSITFNLCGLNETTSTNNIYCGIFAVTGATPAGVPTKPVATAATKNEGDGSGAFYANWNEVTGATSYRLDVATDRNFTDILLDYNNKNVGNVTSVAVSGDGINPATTYYYRVRAVNTSGQSLSSNRISTDLPIWIKNALEASDYAHVKYDAEENKISFDQDVKLKDTLVLQADEATTIDLGGHIITAPAGKPAVSAADRAQVSLTIADSSGGGGKLTGSAGSSAGAAGSAAIDLRNAGAGSSVNVSGSATITGGNGADAADSGSAGAGGAAIIIPGSAMVTIGSSATVIGGNGGSANGSGNGGQGGAGISGGTSVTVTTGGTVTGGNGGNSASGRPGTGGAAGTTSGASGNPGVTSHRITVENDGHGTAAAYVAGTAVTFAGSGAAVTLLATPDSGYRLKGWSVSEGGITISNNQFTMPNVNVTVKAEFEQIPSGSGSGTSGGGSGSSGGSDTPTKPAAPTENYTIPVKNENTVQVEAKITDSKANVSEITTDTIDKVVKNTGTESRVDTITIDLSGAKQEVTGVILSKTTVETLAQVTAEAGNGIETATVELSNATVILDNKTLETLVDQAKGSQIELVVADTEHKNLNTAQQTTLSNYQMATTFEAYFTSDGQRISDFKGGTAIVSIKFTPEAGKDVSFYHIVYVAENGQVERYKTKYESGKLFFTTTHFSDYAVVYDTSEKNETEEQPKEENADAKVTLDTTFRKLQLAEAKTTKNAVKISWKKVTDADGYVLYGAPCNTKDKTYKMKKLAVIKNGSKITYTDKKLKSGTYYKYYIKAYKLVNGKKVWLAKSKVIHVTTSGGKYGNAKAVKVDKTKVTLKKGKSLVIKASQLVESKPIKQHVSIRFESTNTKIATVTKNGRIKAKKKGTCYIYVYAQNGVYKRIKVVVS